MSDFKPAQSTVPPEEVRERLIKVLRKMDEGTNKLEDRLQFLLEHNLHKEAEWVRAEIDQRGRLFITICNDVLEIYF